MKPLFLKFEVLMEKKQEPSNETVHHYKSRILASNTI